MSRLWHVGLSDTGLAWCEVYADTEEEACQLAEKKLEEYIEIDTVLVAYEIETSDLEGEDEPRN